jgi:N-acetylglucosaminyldiphosphoundecaprenol N-acetyl-beta-D-mannosaminyltransferase
MYILGVKINKITSKKVLDEIKDFLLSDKQNYIITLNPEMVVEAQKDEEYFHILNNADLSITDGTGLKLAGLITGNNIKRIPGADLTKKILRIAENKKSKVAILNWSGGLSKKEDIKKALAKKYPDLKFIVENIEQNFTDFIKTESFTNLLKLKPDILFITLGAPYQEKWIYHNLKKMPSVKLAIGVGGSFDFISGKTKRAPLIFQKLGLEWLWRLILEPRRIKRIYNATIKFGWMVLKK